MEQNATRKDIDEVIDIMKTMMGQMSNQFAEVDSRLVTIDQKYDHLISTIDGFIGRIDKYETELAARDSQFERLLSWAKKVSKQTGIALEDF